MEGQLRYEPGNEILKKRLENTVDWNCQDDNTSLDLFGSDISDHDGCTSDDCSLIMTSNPMATQPLIHQCSTPVKNKAKVINLSF